ncbi:hypothetical protein FACS1894199_18480 [Bacteroidia bacterium]|nr:hypothetical protein FACS1894199_18480 [Bacteroidia bacterium]
MMETAANIEMTHEHSIQIDEIHSAWGRFCQRCEDYWDLFTIWLRRNDEKISLEEFNKYVDDLIAEKNV